MEELKTLAQHGLQSDEDALEKLQLLQLGSVDCPELEELTHKELNRLYQETAVIRSAAELIKRKPIMKCSHHLMELLYHLSKKIFKKSIYYTISKEEILKEMSKQVKTILDLSIKIGEDEKKSIYVKSLSWYLDKIQSALGGDEMSMRDLGLLKLPSLRIKYLKQTPCMATLFASFGSAAEMATMAKYIGDNSLLKVNCLIASICEEIQERYHPRMKPLKVKIDGSDVCHSLMPEITELQQWVHDIESRRMKEVVDTSADLEQEVIEQEQDPTYSPGSGEEDKSSSDDRVVAPSVEASPQKFHKTLKRKLEPSLNTSQPIKKRKLSGTRPRSHHVKRTCPVCKKEDSNLKRHLLSHARKGQITFESVEAIVSITIKKGKRRGPGRSTEKEVRKGLKLKWCPVKDCHKVTHLLRSHLSNFHRIKPGVLMSGRTGWTQTWSV